MWHMPSTFCMEKTSSIVIWQQPTYCWQRNCGCQGIRLWCFENRESRSQFNSGTWQYDCNTSWSTEISNLCCDNRCKHPMPTDEFIQSFSSECPNGKGDPSIHSIHQQCKPIVLFIILRNHALQIYVMQKNTEKKSCAMDWLAHLQDQKKRKHTQNIYCGRTVLMKIALESPEGLSDELDRLRMFGLESLEELLIDNQTIFMYWLSLIS